MCVFLSITYIVSRYILIYASLCVLVLCWLEIQDISQTLPGEYITIYKIEADCTNMVKLIPEMSTVSFMVLIPWCPATCLKLYQSLSQNGQIIEQCLLCEKNVNK